MTGHIKVAGTWKEVSNIYSRVGGAWKDVESAFTKVGGVWKQWYASGFPGYVAPTSVSQTATNYRRIVFATATSTTLTAQHTQTRMTSGHSSQTKLYNTHGKWYNLSDNSNFRKFFTYATETAGTLSNSTRSISQAAGLSNQGTAGYSMGGDDDTNVGSVYAYRLKTSHSTEVESSLTDSSIGVSLWGVGGLSRTGIAGYGWTGYATGVQVFSNALKQNFTNDVQSIVNTGITVPHPYSSKACNPTTAGYAFFNQTGDVRKLAFATETASTVTGVGSFPANFVQWMNVSGDAGYAMSSYFNTKFSFPTETQSTWNPGSLGGDAEPIYHGTIGDGN